MVYRVIKKVAFNVVVISEDFDAESSQSGIPAFWGKYFSEGLQKKVAPMMGVCGEMSADGKKMAYGIGCPSEFAPEIPEGFVKWSIPACTWAVFDCVGKIPDVMQKKWQEIYEENFNGEKYEMIAGYQIENYTEGDTSADDYYSEIWIPVKERQ